MSIKTFNWNLDMTGAHMVERYCHNCGKKTIFTDSQKRRRNGNGKTIYEYAIYKCDREHTWNKLLTSYSAHTDINVFLEEESRELSLFEMPEEIIISDIQSQGIEEVRIKITSAASRLRIDKLLAQQIKDISRTQIRSLIEKGRILIDGQPVKPDTIVKSDNEINIMLKEK
ncbi:MAG: S4 domain-containing protein [Bacillota bacterium]